MIRTSKAPVPWKVPWREERTYFIRAGDPMERDEMPEYRPGLDGLVPLDLVSEIPGLEMKAAGAFAVSLLYASGRDKEGNSARLSSSAESRKTSSSRAGGKAGRSPASASSRKTPSSRSRPGRSRS
jgi:hypothetical protein